MKLSRTLFRLCLIFGIGFILAGITMKSLNVYSEGFMTGRSGQMSHGIINGNGAIYLGVIFLLLSIWTYKGYKEDKEKYNKMK